MRTSKKQPDLPEQTESATNQAVSPDQQDVVHQLAAEKKRRRARPLLVSIMTILLIGLGAFLAWFVIDSTQSEQTADNREAPSQEDIDIARLHDASWAIEQVRTVFDTDSTDIERPLLAVQTSGADFATDAYSKDAYRGISGSVPADERNVVVAEIGKVLTDDDFTANVSRTNDETTYSARYYGSDAACVIDSQGSRDNPAADHALQVACIDVSTLNDLADQQRPFYEASVDETSLAAAALLAGPRIEQSDVDGYQRAALRVGPANLSGGTGTMYFYQTRADKWTYITTVGDTGPGGVQCDALNEDAKKAYQGEICYDELEQSRVE